MFLDHKYHLYSAFFLSWRVTVWLHIKYHVHVKYSNHVNNTIRHFCKGNRKYHTNWNHRMNSRKPYSISLFLWKYLYILLMILTKWQGYQVLSCLKEFRLVKNLYNRAEAFINIARNIDIGYSPKRWGAYKINNIFYMLITRRPSGNNKKIFLDPWKISSQKFRHIHSKVCFAWFFKIFLQSNYLHYLNACFWPTQVSK